MVVVHRARGFRFVIYTQDHEPAHVHITGAGQAKVNLISDGGTPVLVSSIAISQPELKRLVAEVFKHRDRFLAEWERIHGPCKRG